VDECLRCRRAAAAGITVIRKIGLVCAQRGEEPALANTALLLGFQFVPLTLLLFFVFPRSPLRQEDGGSTDSPWHLCRVAVSDPITLTWRDPKKRRSKAAKELILDECEGGVSVGHKTPAFWAQVG